MDVGYVFDNIWFSLRRLSRLMTPELIGSLVDVCPKKNRLGSSIDMGYGMRTAVSEFLASKFHESKPLSWALILISTINKSS